MSDTSQPDDQISATDKTFENEADLRTGQGPSSERPEVNALTERKADSA